jgi:hypothetical protein
VLNVLFLGVSDLWNPTKVPPQGFSGEPILILAGGFAADD